MTETGKQARLILSLTGPSAPPPSLFQPVLLTPLNRCKFPKLLNQQPTTNNQHTLAYLTLLPKLRSLFPIPSRFGTRHDPTSSGIYALALGHPSSTVSSHAGHLHCGVRLALAKMLHRSKLGAFCSPRTRVITSRNQHFRRANAGLALIPFYSPPKTSKARLDREFVKINKYLI